MQEDKLTESMSELKRIAKQKLYETPKPTLPSGIRQEVKELREPNKLYKPDLSQPSQPTKSLFTIFY
jgi:hypothetical protein